MALDSLGDQQIQNFVGNGKPPFMLVCLTGSDRKVTFKGEVKAKIKISPVVVFGVLSRMVLVRESRDAPFLLESQSNSRTSTETG